MAVPTFNIPSQTEWTLNTIVNEDVGTIPTPQRTKTQFFSDIDKMLATWQFADKKDAMIETAKYANSKWIQYEWISYDELFKSNAPEVKAEQIEEGTTQWFLESTADIVTQDIPKAIEQVWEFGSLISETAQDFKFDSNVDDNIVVSWLKFLGNLPANTAQIGWDILNIVANPLDTLDSVNTLAKAWIESGLNKIFLDEWEEFFTSEEVELVAESVWKELGKLWEPGRIKELLVENPADVLLTFMWGAWIAKNVAKSKWLTWLATKLEKVETALNPIKLQADALKLTKKGAGNIKTQLFPEKSLDELVLEISQWEKANIPAVKKSLWLIDTKEINTFEDFNSTISNKITEISRKQDTLLPTDEVLKIDNLTTTQGKRSTNFVNNALNDLEEVWVKSNDLGLLNKVDDLRDKSALSVKDINDLARFYGSEFKTKSFDKAGNQKSSITASTFENNRKWLKEISRELLPDDAVKTLDSELSTLFETKELTTKTVKKVDDLFKKLNKRGLWAKIGGAIGKLINTISLGTAGWLVQAFIWSNVWQKTMNNLAIQANLAKNLKRFEELAKKADKMTDKQLEIEVKKTFWDFVWENALEIETASNLENN